MQEYKTIFIQSGKTSSVLTSPPFFLFNYQENCMSNYVLEISFLLFTFQFRAAVISWLIDRKIIANYLVLAGWKKWHDDVTPGAEKFWWPFFDIENNDQMN